MPLPFTFQANHNLKIKKRRYSRANPVYSSVILLHIKKFNAIQTRQHISGKTGSLNELFNCVILTKAGEAAFV
jgi:hypothetical protein